MIDRRSFLRILLASPLVATLDVEQLLWVPKPIIVVPAMPTRWLIHIEEINRIAMRQIMPVVSDMYFRSDPFLAMLGKAKVDGSLSVQSPRLQRQLFGISGDPE